MTMAQTGMFWRETVSTREHVFELDYNIFEEDTVENGPVLAFFIAEDGTEVSTDPNDDMTPHVAIDGTRPIVTDDGAMPDPFNPKIQVIYIRYILTEQSDVTINVYDSKNQLVRKLGTPSGKPGENYTSWDGTDDLGNMMPDGVYTYEISATDRAGNKAVPIRGGCILTTVYMELDNSLVAPNPFSPDGDGVEDVTWITFDIRVYATEEQLHILGFGNDNDVTLDPDDDDQINPFALIGVSIFTPSGEVMHVFSHDMTPDADTDFAPNGWPGGKMPKDVPPGSGNYFGTPNLLMDVPDEKKGNDWDTLVPLTGPIETEKGTLYQSRFSLGWDAKKTPDGTYLINLACELVGRTFEFGGFKIGPSGAILGEKWHAGVQAILAGL